MAILNFPDNPQENDQYTGDNGTTYIYDGVKWVGRAAGGAAGTNSLQNGSYTVQVDVNGDLILPVGSTIKDANGNSIGGGSGVDGLTGDTDFEPEEEGDTRYELNINEDITLRVYQGGVEPDDLGPGISLGFENGGQHGSGVVAIGNSDTGYKSKKGGVYIGYEAGWNNPESPQGEYAIAIGTRAARNFALDNSITLNATGVALDPDEPGLFIKPVREDVENTAKAVYYNTTTGEMTYADPTGGATGDQNVWIQDFETTIGSPTDVVGIASSVEYLSNGDLVALFNHYTDDNGTQGTYNSVARFDSTGTKIWATGFSGATYTDGWGLAVDSDFIYVAGTASGEVYTSGVLTKIDSADGTIVWSKVYDVGFNNTNAVVDVASDGNPVIVGYCDNNDDNQILTTKVDASTGAVIWSRALNGQNGEEAYGMAVGPSGEIVAVGYMDNIEHVGPTNTILTLTAYPTSDPDWTVNLTSVTNGGLTFDVSFTDGVPSFSNIVDLDGNHYEGESIGTIASSSLGAGTTDLQFSVGTVTNEDLTDRMLVVKYDSTGTIQWQKAVQVETGFDCYGADADIDGNGNIYVCGQFDYDNGGGTSNAMVIIKFNSGGVKQWSRKVVGDCDDWSSSIVVGPDDNLYLSAVTASAGSEDFTLVVAKYNLDGTVAWQRLLDNTTSWTFAGGYWFGPTGGSGSTLAVKSGYVSIVGGFGDPFGTVPHAIVAQFDSAGTVWSVGDYDFKAASFSGLLDASASNITVDDAAKTDFDQSGNFNTYDFEPGSNSTNFLLGTLYSQANGAGTGDVTFSTNVVEGSGWELGLSPGPDFTTGAYTSGGPDLGPQYFRVRGGDNWEHLHFDTTANNLFDLYIGDDDTYFKLSKDGQAVIGTEARTEPYDRYNWTFGIDGTTTFPTLTVPISDNATPSGTGQTLKFSDPSQQAIIYGPLSTADYNSAERVIIQGAPGYTGTSGEGGDVYLWAGPGGDTGGDGGDIKIRAGRGQLAGSGGYLNFQAGQSGTGYGGYINIESGSSDTFGQGGYIRLDAHSGAQITLRTYNSEGNSRELVLDNTGTTTFPGAIVKSTISKTGVAPDTGLATTIIDSGGWTDLVDSSYGPFTLGPVTFTVVVTSGLPSYTVTGTSGNSTVNDVIGTLNSADMGGAGTHVSNVSVATVTQASTAIDLTKSINKLTDGSYSLADGVEGQIVYLVPSPETNDVTAIGVRVEHARDGANQFIDGFLYPFSYFVGSEQMFTSMCTLIFTDGHWQQTGGAWD